MEPQAVTLHEAGGQIAYRFHARDLNLVIGPTDSGASVRFRRAHRRAAARCGTRCRYR